MLRLLLNIPFQVHIFVLILIPLLRLPTFNPDFLLPDESLYLMLARQIADGGHLYQDAWFSGPPVMVWFYTFFQWLFGKNSLLAIRIFSCIYVYLGAMIFNGMVVENKPFKRFTGLPAVLYVILVSGPWFSQQFSSSLFALLPITLAFYAFSKVGEDRRNNYSLMFLSGAWMMLCILSTYKSVFILGGMVIAYIFLKKPAADEFLSLLGGMVAILGGVLLILYFNQSIDSYWDIGVLYYLDRVGDTDPAIYQYKEMPALSIWLRTWAVVLFLTIIGFAHFRLRFFSYVTKIRSLELTMAVWIVGVFLVLGFKFNRLELDDFLLLVPPIAFYTSKMFDFKLVYRFRVLIFLFMFGFPLFQYLNYWGIVWEKMPGIFKPGENSYVLHGNTREFLLSEHPLSEYLSDKKVANGIWMMEFRPEIYISTGLVSANKYTDFRIAYYKFPVFDQRHGKTILSAKEPEREIYAAFENRMPDYIIDPRDYFTHLQQRYPGLFGVYRKDSLDGYTIYHLPKPANRTAFVRP